MLALGPAARGQERLDLTSPSKAERSPEERDFESDRAALDLARRLGHVEAEAEAHYALAVRARELGHSDAAKTHGDAALGLYERLHDPVGAAAAHDLLGALEAENGHLDAARAAFERALALRREAGDTAGEATSLHNLASCALDRGDAAGALASLGHALELHRRRGDEAAQAAARSNLGLLRLQIGRLHRARRDLDEAAALYRRHGDERGLAGVLNNLGLLEYAEKRHEDATRHFRQALHILRRLGSIDGAVIGTGPATDIVSATEQAKIRGNLGLALAELGEWSEARRELEAALDLAHRHALHRVEASHRGSLGRLELRQAQRGEKRPDEAVATLARAAADLEALEAPRARGATLLDLAEALRLRGETTEALACIEEAIELFESLRRPLARDGSAIAHALAVERHAYDLRVDLLVELERPREALAASESARARGLLNLLRGMAIEGARPSIETSGIFSDAVSAEKLDELLDTDTLLLVYHLGERSAWIFSLGPSADGPFELHVRSLGSSAEIETLAARTHENLALSRRRAYRGPARQAASELAGRLLPDAATLRRHSRLVVVPDGGLHRVPFAALTDALEATPPEIVRVPSLAVLAELRRRAHPATAPETTSLAILADPIFDAGDERLAGRRTPPTTEPTAEGRRSFERLTWSGVEAERIAALFPPGTVDLRLGLDAGEDALLGGGLSRHSRLHFATHALVDDVEPERSGLALSVYSRAFDAGSSDSNRLEARRGFVELAELFELRLDAELVTLSACRSALGKSLRGEGLLGLSHGFFTAGARRLVLSLWDVDDRATSALMEHFYRALAAGERPAAALDSARRAMHQDPRWRAPFYWAGFVLIGDWR